MDTIKISSIVWCCLATACVLLVTWHALASEWANPTLSFANNHGVSFDRLTLEGNKDLISVVLEWDRGSFDPSAHGNCDLTIQLFDNPGPNPGTNTLIHEKVVTGQGGTHEAPLFERDTSNKHTLFAQLVCKEATVHHHLTNTYESTLTKLPAGESPSVNTTQWTHCDSEGHLRAHIEHRAPDDDEGYELFLVYRDKNNAQFTYQTGHEPSPDSHEIMEHIIVKSTMLVTGGTWPFTGVHASLVQDGAVVAMSPFRAVDCTIEPDLGPPYAPGSNVGGPEGPGAGPSGPGPGPGPSGPGTGPGPGPSGPGTGPGPGPGPS